VLDAVLAQAYLRRLDVAQCQLGEALTLALPTAAAIGGQAELLRLDLGGNALHSASALGHVCGALGRLPRLRHLHLDRNDLGRASDLSPLCAVLATSTLRATLRRLTLSGNRFVSSSTAALAPAIAALTRLTALDLSFNDLGDEGAAALASALQQLARLEALHLTCVTARCGAAGREALYASLGRLPALWRLVLSNNVVDDGGADALCRSLQHLPRLRVLDLSSTNCTAAHLAAVAPALRGAAGSLAALALDHPRLGTGDIAPFAAAVGRCTGLRTVSLGCALSDFLDTVAEPILADDYAPCCDGAPPRAWVDPRPPSPALANLRLLVGALAAPGVAATLTELNLSHLQLEYGGRSAAAAVAPLLTAASALTSVDLSFAALGCTGVLDVAPLCAAVPLLRRLSLACNNAAIGGGGGADAAVRHRAMDASLAAMLRGLVFLDNFDGRGNNLDSCELFCAAAQARLATEPGLDVVY
jgi:hypothetical protein